MAATTPAVHAANADSYASKPRLCRRDTTWFCFSRYAVTAATSSAADAYRRWCSLMGLPALGAR